MRRTILTKTPAPTNSLARRNSKNCAAPKRRAKKWNHRFLETGRDRKIMGPAGDAHCRPPA
jgi:hypothetical protein